MKMQSDAELVAAAVAGRSGAFAILVRRYERPVPQLGSTMMALKSIGSDGALASNPPGV